MASKIPRLSAAGGSTMTDDEKLNFMNVTRPKQTVVKPSATMKTGNTESTKMKRIQNEPKLVKNKTVPYSGLMLKPKTTEKPKSTRFNIQKEETVEKGCVSDQENTEIVKPSEKGISCGSGKEKAQKQVLVNTVNPNNTRKTGVVNRNRIPDKPNSPGFSGLTFVPKEHRSQKPIFEPSKTMRRSKTEADIKIAKPSKKDKLMDIGVALTKSETSSQRELTDILSPEIPDEIQEELAEELFASKKDNFHGGLTFIPKNKKKKGLAFNFNKQAKNSE